MKSLRTIGNLGLALTAVLLLSGIVAASASAAKFEAEPGFPVKFTGEGAAGTLETKGGHVVTCASTEASGEVSGATEVKSVLVTFKGCFAEHLATLTCQSKGATLPGEIVTSSIKATPVDTNAGKTEAGLLLAPESGTVFVVFSCELGPIQEEVTVEGSIIGKVPNKELNEFRETLHLEFHETEGTPTPNQVEGTGEKHVLLTTGKGTEPFEAEESGIEEAVPGTTTTKALGGKKIKLVVP